MSAFFKKLMDGIRAVGGFFIQPDAAPPSGFDADAFVEEWNRANPYPFWPSLRVTVIIQQPPTRR